MTPSPHIERLIEIMAALRTPGSGCPWDLAQDFTTIAPYTIEEAYEVADAIGRGDFDDLRDELGDLLLQVVFHARMAEEARMFAFGDVVQTITEKLVRRHPHVFGDAGSLDTEAVNALWDRIKAQEKAERSARRAVDPQGTAETSAGTLAGVPVTLPALTRALKLQDKAGKGKSATFCSPWSIWRAISAPTRKPRCAPPTGNSNADSATSNRRWRQPAKRPHSRRSPKWTICGMPPSAMNGSVWPKAVHSA
jgi:uncharacterized protein YabN with tetrapyrrole methylase and pyrophosphatase domain